MAELGFELRGADGRAGCLRGLCAVQPLGDVHVVSERGIVEPWP